MLLGLGICGVAGFAFFVTCLGMMGRGDAWSSIVVPIVIALGIGGVLVMLAGFVMAIMESLKR